MIQNQIMEALDFLKKMIENSTAILEEIRYACFPNPDRYLTTGEAMHRLQRSRKTLHNWVEKGLLTKEQIGGGKYYLESQVEKLVNKHGVKSSGAGKSG